MFVGKINRKVKIKISGIGANCNFILLTRL